jgi:monoamine oxidase
MSTKIVKNAGLCGSFYNYLSPFLLWQMGKQVIIIGAGAAGLQAGRRLSKEGYSVTILEANSIPGGRIHSFPAGGPAGFSMTVEGGAEFVHGDLPLSLELAKEAGVVLQPVNSHMVQVRGDREQDFHRDWDELFKQMEILPEDMPFADFLTQYFSGDRYAALRDSVSRMAEGYDLADVRTASTRSLYREWAAEEEGGEEYRPVGGYQQLIDHLVGVCETQGCVIHYSSPVTSVRWEGGKVAVTMASGRVYDAGLLVSTVSLGVLKAAGISFSPELPVAHRAAIKKLGFGSVIKVLLEFDEAFWNSRKQPGQTLFILSDEALPTWWTQPADDCRLITGWVAGKKMLALRALDKEARITAALQSLAGIFELDSNRLHSRLRASLILDWAASPAVCGGYSFDTVGAADARIALSQPVEGTLYFSGEGLYEGDVPGTVEAAFCSGITVADKIIAQS